LPSAAEDSDPPSEPPRREASVALRNAGVFIAVVIGGFTVNFFHAIVTPLVIAVFLLLLIDGFSRAVERRLPRCPEWLRSVMGAGLTLGGFALIVVVCARYGREFGSQVSVLVPKLDDLLAQVCISFQIPILTLGDLWRGASPGSMVKGVFEAARGTLSEAVLVVIYLGFLLASRQAFGRKATRLFHTARGQANAERVFNRVRGASEQYIGLQTFKAALVALCAWAIMAAVGLANAFSLAFVLFLLAYVPIVGGLVGVAIPSLIAVAQFDTPVRPLVLLALLGGIFLLIENVLLPKLQSESLNLDPVFVLLSLGFWGVMLGLPGVLLSTPLTVVVMAVTSEFEGARWLAVLLSKDGDPGPHDEAVDKPAPAR
jgi:predicted PurR-regulated permease PerM